MGLKYYMYNFCHKEDQIQISLLLSTVIFWCPWEKGGRIPYLGILKSTDTHLLHNMACLHKTYTHPPHILLSALAFLNTLRNSKAMYVIVILFREIAIREISLFRTDMMFIPICSICVESGDAEVWVLRMYPHNELTQSEDFFFKTQNGMCHKFQGWAFGCVSGAGRPGSWPWYETLFIFGVCLSSGAHPGLALVD